MPCPATINYKISEDGDEHLYDVHHEEGYKAPIYLPFMPSGCDATSYMHRVGKVILMRKLLKDPSMSEWTATSSRTVEGRKYAFYEKMKVKTSASLPPEPSSLVQALKRVHLQIRIWSYCSEVVIPEIDPVEYGWRFDQGEDKLVPVWYIGPQLPPSFARKSSPIQTAGTDGDDEESKNGEVPKTVRFQKE